ncbi:amidohydrolase family-domain-containing protein [Emericellopsis atlantica]|uniref:Amidohydrolase family-domain-containing protein n=1 Tax=Emericellopsis atlantica TaxID=2614577 RepID=A0A9P7ZSN4_9HYPO|nr:amidohydrolase family-domain-containing protein [Emericellopsis atlantica]KAG9257614.1 amidohydrolase family-domain-containing protein [Emericellopsis atlantica]
MGLTRRHTRRFCSSQAAHPDCWIPYIIIRVLVCNQLIFPKLITLASIPDQNNQSSHSLARHLTRTFNMTAAHSAKTDLVIRAGTVHSLDTGAPIYKSIALRDGRIVAVSEDLNGLDGYIDTETQVINEPEHTALPAFDDTHTHLIFAGLGHFSVPVHQATCIDDLLALLRQHASKTEPGSWITTTANWQEYNLKERRFPTALELDGASRTHPIVLRRGGHNIVVNSLALKLGGITTASTSPPGGKIGRTNDGSLNGHLQDQGMMPILRLLPQQTLEQRIIGLDAASAAYAAKGIGCVRDCAVPISDVPVLMAAREAGKLHIRVRALVSSIGMTSSVAVTGLLDQMEEYRHLQHDSMLSIWGVKFTMDGGIEAGATKEPYEGRPDEGCCGPTDFRGILSWDVSKMVEAMDVVLRRGWRIGTHAYGDRAVETLLDVYGRLQERHPSLPPHSLVMEHGALVDPATQARAVRMGIPVTIQQPLLHDVAAIQSLYFGKERTARLFPARSWLDAGALVGGGSDYPIGRFGAMRSIWGMTTRTTVAGVMGIEHAITCDEAVALHTTQAAELLNETSLRGTLTPGKLADLTIWPIDPLANQDLLELRDLEPSYTIINGCIEHAPGKSLV